MSTKKIVANTLYYGVIPKITLLISVFTLPITTRYLSPFDYGIVGIITSYTAILSSIAPLGMNVHLTNSFYENPNHYNLNWGRILFVFLVSGFLLGLLNIGILYLALPIKSYKGIILALFGSVQIFLFANAILAQHLFPLLSNPKPLVFTNLFASVVGIIVSFMMIVFFDMGYWGLIASPAISAILAFAMFIYPIWVQRSIYPIVEKNKKRLREYFKIALPIIPHTLGFVLLTSSARIVMNFYDVSISEIGLFSHGNTIGDYVMVITNALILALAPQIQVAYRNRDFSKYRKLYALCQGVALACTFLFCIWLPQVYDLLIKNVELKQSVGIASMMCFANIVFSFYSFASTPAFIQKKTLQLLWLVFLPGILNVILCLIFIPVFGYKAAIYTTIVSYWSQLTVPFFVPYYSQNVKEWIQRKRNIIYLTFILVSAVVVGNIIMDMTIWLKIVFSIVILIAALMVYRKYKFNTII